VRAVKASRELFLLHVEFSHFVLIVVEVISFFLVWYFFFHCHKRERAVKVII